MLFLGQTGGVEEIRICQTKSNGLLIHHFSKSVFTARDVFSQATLASLPD